MSSIKLLDNITIDKIAAGEVVESPVSVVKELVENSMDSGATAIKVEIKNGGIEYIRVTDNGSGISPDDIEIAFLRHATSKINSIDDLDSVVSMGFRGEALASISSVAKVELITKCRNNLTGIRYVVCGGEADKPEEIGCGDGTTIIVRNLFYNTPARRKFLKSEAQEGSRVIELMERLALARPDISFEVVVNGKVRFQTSGNNDLKEIIYRLYGREVVYDVIPVDTDMDGIRIQGYLGKPSQNRASRTFETYFLNHRYIKSDCLSKGIEEAYKEYRMQHKFPFCVLHFSIDTYRVDVNVHPSKREVRFQESSKIYEAVYNSIRNVLKSNEMIPEVRLSDEADRPEFEKNSEIFEVNRRNEEAAESKKQSALDTGTEKKEKEIFSISFDDDEEENNGNSFVKDKEGDNTASCVKEDDNCREAISIKDEAGIKQQTFDNALKDIVITDENQMNFLDTRVVSKEARKKYRLIGQMFSTYWLFEYDGSIYFVDQHAAHEKVNYERLLKRCVNDDSFAQQLNPPIVVTLSQSEADIYISNSKYFEKLGFEIDEYGGNEYAIRAVPYELYNNDPKSLLIEIIDEINEKGVTGTPDAVLAKIASMACKASVKGGMEISRGEMEALFDELILLDNPYHCPHGRPTMFSMSKYELEKKFKRIVD